MEIGVLGFSGFLGGNLLKALPNSFGINIRDKNWDDVVSKSGAKSLINLVGKAHDHQGIATEDDYYHANFILLKEMFSVFLKSSANLFIHISSLAALEEFKSDIALQEFSSCNPTSWYGKSKRAAEEWLLEQEMPVGKKLIILRPPMIHGPGDKGNLTLLYKFISKGIPYPLSSYNNKRSFLFVHNLSFIIQQIIENFEKMESGIYHIADDDFISTNDIITIIKKVEKKRIPNISFPKFFINGLARVGDKFSFIPLNSKRLLKMTSNLLVSNEKIKRSLNIDKMPFTAKEGLEITIKSFHKDR